MYNPGLNYDKTFLIVHDCEKYEFMPRTTDAVENYDWTRIGGNAQQDIRWMVKADGLHCSIKGEASRPRLKAPTAGA